MLDVTQHSEKMIVLLKMTDTQKINEHRLKDLLYVKVAVLFIARIDHIEHFIGFTSWLTLTTKKKSQYIHLGTKILTTSISTQFQQFIYLFKIKLS